MSSADLQRYIRFLEGMTAEHVEDLGTVMAKNVRFVDPFNDVTGLESARAVFRHMFESLDKVRFRVSRSALDAGDSSFAMLSWELDAEYGGRPYRVTGMSELQLTPEGKVILHVDHWDSGRQFYEHLPILGWMLRQIRRRLKVS